MHIVLFEGALSHLSCFLFLLLFGYYNKRYLDSMFVLQRLEVYSVALCFSFLIAVLSMNGRRCCLSFLLWNDCLGEIRVSPGCYGDSQVSQSALSDAHLQWAREYESGSDSDTDRPDPDLVLDDLASRRFHSPSPAPPTNFAVPISPQVGGRVAGGRGDTLPKVTITPTVVPQQNVACLRSENMKQWRDFDVPAW